MKTPQRNQKGINLALDCRYVQGGFPGIGRYTYNLAAALAELETVPPFKLNLIYNPSLPDNRHNLRELSNLFPERVKLAETTARPFSPAEQWQLPLLAKREKFDLWHAPYYVRPYLLPCASIISLHDLIGKRLPQTLPSNKARVAFEVTTRLALAASSKIIAPSESTRRDIIKCYGISSERIKTILEGVEKKFKPVESPEERAQIQARLGLPENYLLYVGINKPHKNLNRLIEAFALFRWRNPDSRIELVMAGKEDPRYSPVIKAQIKNLGLEKYTHSLGEVTDEDLIKIYGCARLFVMPSLYEGFGLPLLEAQACGVPVICSGNSSLPEVGGNHVPTFDPYDIISMANAIEKILKSEELIAQQREAGLARAKTLTWKKAAASGFELYLETLREKNLGFL